MRLAWNLKGGSFNEDWNMGRAQIVGLIRTARTIGGPINCPKCKVAESPIQLDSGLYLK